MRRVSPCHCGRRLAWRACGQWSRSSGACAARACALASAGTFASRFDALRLREGVRALEPRLNEQAMVDGVAIPVADAGEQIQIACRGWPKHRIECGVVAALRIG